MRIPRSIVGIASGFVLSLGAGSILAEPTATDPAGLDAELVREIEEAARLDRELRAARRVAVADERSRQAADDATRIRREEATASAAARGIEAELARERARQADLLGAVTGRGPKTGSPLPPPPVVDDDYADPRIAAPSPPLRELPDEIFDRSDEIIRAGTWGNREELRVVRLVLDADGDRHPELIRYVDRKSGKLLRQEEDRNFDGVIDSWWQFESGVLRSRTLDGNDDGNPDAFETYAEGRMVARELDRDDDGVRDVFYRYRGDSLVEERHDSNNDGVIDIVIVYEERLRVRTEEDVDRDGRMDVWTRYVNEGGHERVARIERDSRGNGLADTFEVFEAKGGSSILLRREEDLDGDGRIDVVSFYVGGKLRRRQIRDGDVVPM